MNTRTVRVVNAFAVIIAIMAELISQLGVLFSVGAEIATEQFQEKVMPKVEDKLESSGVKDKVVRMVQLVNEKRQELRQQLQLKGFELGGSTVTDNKDYSEGQTVSTKSKKHGLEYVKMLDKQSSEA